MSLPVSFSYSTSSTTSIVALGAQFATMTSTNATIPPKTWRVCVGTTAGTGDVVVVGKDINGDTLAPETITIVGANFLALGVNQYSQILSVTNTSGGALTGATVGVADYISASQVGVNAAVAVIHGNLDATNITGTVPTVGTQFSATATVGCKTMIYSAIDISLNTYTVSGNTTTPADDQTDAIVGPDAALTNYTVGAMTYNCVKSVTNTTIVTTAAAYTVGVLDLIAVSQAVADAAPFVLNGILGAAPSFPSQNWYLLSRAGSAGTNDLTFSVVEHGFNQFAGATTETLTAATDYWKSTAKCYKTLTNSTSLTAIANYNVGVKSILANPQNVTASTALVLQQAVITFPTGKSGKVILTGAAQDFSAVTFTIAGTLSTGGGATTKTVLGPVANRYTICSDPDGIPYTWSIITSITPNAHSVAQPLSVGIADYITPNVAVATPVGALTLTSSPYIFADGTPRFITLSSGSDMSAFTFTATGLDEDGNAVSYDFAVGPNVGLVTSTQLFTAVYSITNTSATGFYTTISAGTDAAFSGQWVNLDFNRSSPFNASLCVKITGTKTYSLDVTPDIEVYQNDVTNIFPVAIGTATYNSDQVIQMNYPMTGVRFTSVSGTGSATFTVIQQGN